MKVSLIAHTPDSESLIAAAARLCYSSKSIDEILESSENADAFIENLLAMGHQSPIEHASFTFAIEGVSRALLAQITRHRIASFSVKSQRYVNEAGLSYVTPPQIAQNPEAAEIFHKTVKNIQENYTKITDLLKKELEANGVPSAQAEKTAIEDARFLLPNACETKLIMTMNARELFHFFRLRCCNRAQWEIRDLADEMLKLVTKVAPTLFKKAGAPCVSGPCLEGAKTCGKPRKR